MESISVAIYGAYDNSATGYFNGYSQYLVTSNWWDYQGNRYWGTREISSSIINALKQSDSNIINISLNVNDYGDGGGGRGYMVFTITEISQ